MKALSAIRFFWRRDYQSRVTCFKSSSGGHTAGFRASRLTTAATLVVFLIAGNGLFAAFDLDEVAKRAEALAAKPYVTPAENLPPWMLKLNYDQHRDIRYDPKKTWWRNDKLPFELQFFHPGWLFKTPVTIHEVVEGKERALDYDRALFDYGRNKPGEVPEHTGFAGFKVLYPLNRAGDELAVFLGASYFRAVGRGMAYGLSARGLAVNTGEPGPEEFPRFDEFWIERPDAKAGTLTLYALLNSPSVTGAYRFTLRPGDETVIDVKAVLYFRTHPAVVGLAPLTSMFQHGENSGWSRNDFRPEVHDSDGLLLNTGKDEWIWRPLANPPGTRVSSFSDKSPRGFGLMQRDREYAHYDDLEANYHQRPSAWVEPKGDWGAGAIRLLEIRTPDETSDNIVAAWVPEKLPAIGQPLAFEYRLHWLSDPARLPPSGRVASTREGAVLDHPERRRIVVDFSGLPAVAKEPEAVVTVGAGAKLYEHVGVMKIAPLNVWRVVFEVVPDGSGRPVELRCFVREDKDILTETWSNLWNP